MFALDTLTHRLRHGCQTMAYPAGPAPALPDRHGGALRVDSTKCADGCQACVPVCPTQAITRLHSMAKASAVAGALAEKSEAAAGAAVALDLGRCLFCAACVEACPAGAITQTNDHRMAARRREDLLLGRRGEEEARLAEA